MKYRLKDGAIEAEFVPAEFLPEHYAIPNDKQAVCRIMKNEFERLFEPVRETTIHSGVEDAS